MRTLRRIGALTLGAIIATSLAFVGEACVDWSSTASFVVFVGLDYFVFLGLAWSA